MHVELAMLDILHSDQGINFESTVQRKTWVHGGEFVATLILARENLVNLPILRLKIIFKHITESM